MEKAASNEALHMSSGSHRGGLVTYLQLKVVASWYDVSACSRSSLVVLHLESSTSKQ